MFLESHNAVSDSIGPKLAFLPSLDVQAFPCGRRRSEQVTITNSDGIAESFHVPYDPEARLNTEVNNRQQTGLNGFKQSYIKSFADNYNDITLVIAGYIFKITTSYNVQDLGGFRTPYEAFAGTFISDVYSGKRDDIQSIYANIRIEEVPLYTGATTYNTWVIRDQAPAAETNAAITSIDKLASRYKDATSALLKSNPEQCFYFAGLSFSTEALAVDDDNKTVKEQLIETDGKKQRVVSLRILDWDAAAQRWVVHYPALLPKVDHGDSAESVAVANLYADRVFIGRSKNEVPYITLVQTVDAEDADNDVYQLQFSSATVSGMSTPTAPIG